jgi:hypothetical protein
MKTRFLALAAVFLSVLTLSLPVGAAFRPDLDAAPLRSVPKRVLSSAADRALHPQNPENSVSLGRRFAPASSDQAGTSYYPGPNGCSQTLAGNIKVNQDCLHLGDADTQGRGQAQYETTIAADPNNPNHLVASATDHRRGEGTCAAYMSLNGGATWQDVTLPNAFTRGAAFGGVAREYWEESGDTSVAWDTKGNAYLSCLMFRSRSFTTDSPDRSSAVYVFRSTQNNGASWNFPARPVFEAHATVTSSFPLEDKPYLTVDNHPGSPFQDRVYVTWIEFQSDGTAYVWAAYSADYGEHFSNRVLVSSNNPALCTNTYDTPTPLGRCNNNQFPQPFTGADGALYVVFANYNNAVKGTDNRNQILIAKSTNGGASFAPPVKVADYYDLPDCATYQAGQDAGQACMPEKGTNTRSVFRAVNFPSGAANPKNAQEIVVTFGSYINVHSREPQCAPAGQSPTTGLNRFTGVKAMGGCNNDILISVSTNGGMTFTGTTTDPRQLTSVNQSPSQAATDQWWPWAAFTRDGRLAVSYYDRAYGNAEMTGEMDISLAGSKDLETFDTTRVTLSSMPLPTEFANAQGNSLFFGDYAGLAAVDRAYPIWMDTRNTNLFLCPKTGAPNAPPAVCAAIERNGITANDQDIFTQSVTVPTP